MNNNNFIEEKGNSSYTKSIQQYCQNLKVIKKERKWMCSILWVRRLIFNNIYIYIYISTDIFIKLQTEAVYKKSGVTYV
jgi:hypothetical protein